MSDAATLRTRAEGILRPNGREALLVFAGFCALYAVFFSPALLQGSLLAIADGLYLNLPAYYAPPTSWTPFIFSGFPVAAEPHFMMWYPLTLLLSPFRGSWNAFIVAAFVLASCFTYGYVRAVTGSRLAAVVSGIAFGMSAAVVDRLTFPVMIHTLAWLPLAIWGLHEVRSDPRRRWLLVTPIALACMFLAGHPQTFTYCAGLVAAYAVFSGVRRPIARGYWLRLGAIVLLAVGLVAVTLLPALELLPLTTRASLPYREFIAGSLHPVELLNQIYPFVFGGYRGSIYPAYFGFALGPHEVAGYVGVLSLLLALATLIGRAWDREALFWVGWGAFATVLALGGYTPLARLVYHVPGYNTPHAPSRHTFEIALALAVLAGYGARALVTWKPARRAAVVRRVLVLAAVVWLLTQAALIALTPDLAERAAAFGIPVESFLPWSHAGVAVPLMLFALAAALLLWIARAPGTVTPLQRAALVVLLVLDVSSASWFGLWRYGSESADLTPPAWVRRYAEALARSHQRLVSAGGAAQDFRSIAPDVSWLWGVPNASGYTPLILARYSRFLDMTYQGTLRAASFMSEDRALDLMAVRFLTLPTWEAAGAVPVLWRKGVAWAAPSLDLSLGRDCNATGTDEATFHTPAIRADAVAIVTRMACASAVPQGTPALRVVTRTATGEVETDTLRVGVDTAEWAYDQPDLRGAVAHALAPVFAEETAVDDAGRTYRARWYWASLPLEVRGPVTSIQVDRLEGAGALHVSRISAVNRATGEARTITLASGALADASHWRPIERREQVTIFANLRALPRAWLVPQALVTTPEAALEAIRTSRLPNGDAYDPRRVALVEEPVALSGAPGGEDATAANEGGASATVLALADDRIVVRTESRSPAFLVVSDPDYPGWEARVDGTQTRVYRTNYVLRGVVVPAGEHRVVLEFRPRALRIGSWVTAVAALALVPFALFGGREGYRRSR